MRGINRNTFIYFFIVAALVSLYCTDSTAQTLFQQVGIASSPNPVGSGARATGMGGAFIAVADDATAASWNPAGLIQLERPEVSVVGAYVNRSGDFSSAIQPEIDTTARVDDYNLNYLSITYPFNFLKRNMVVSVNYQRLFEFEREIDYTFNFASGGSNLVQDKRLDQDGYLGAVGLAGAIQIIPELSLGVTLNIWTDELWWDNEWEATFSEQGVGTQGGTPIRTSNDITDRYSEFEGINANIGLLWNVTSNVSVGAVIKTPFEANILHEFSSVSRSTLAATRTLTITEKDVTLEMPLSYGVGVGVRISDALSVALDVYRTEWGDYIFTDALDNEFSPIDGRLKSDSDVDATTQVRAGAEYLFIGEKTVVPVRAGLFYDPQPSEGSPEDFYGFSVGSGVAYKNYIFDIAYQLRWGDDVDTGNIINTSEADIIQHLLMASAIIHF